MSAYLHSVSDNLPKVTRRRLIELEGVLAAWQKTKITSTDISALAGWKDSLIRHDLWLAGLGGGVSNGYVTADLLTAVRKVNNPDDNGSRNKFGMTDGQFGMSDGQFGITDSQFGRTNVTNVCIAGLGRLGAALLDEALFEGSGFAIKAGFDSNVNRVEILRSTFPLYPAADMNWVIKQEHISRAILTVAAKDAQAMCDRLVKAGITGIVNMTNSFLRVPENVNVENLSILNSLKIVS